MHKIKEMLHKDSEDTNTSSSSHDSHDSKKLRSSKDDDKKDQNLSSSEFKHNHQKHGEIEHGHSREHDFKQHQHHHEHHTGDHKLQHKEKHIMHEREVVKSKDNDLYREGVDPALDREVVAETRHDGGVHRHRVDEAEVVKETVKEVELHKVQPVVHRERQQHEIRHVVQPHQKFEVKDTEIHHRERDIDLGVRREESTLETSRSLGHAPEIESSREHLGKERQHQELPVKVEEHVHRKVEEHVHPVIYKEVLKPKVTEETHHIYEKVKEHPVETYEVKELNDRSRGTGLEDAQREFFARESSRGIVVDESHTRSLDKTSHKKKDKLKSKKSKKSHEHHTHSHGGDLSREVNTTTTTTIHQEPIIGHHQNIGGHHLAAGAIPAGHNTAYDAALCNQCTDHAICSHSEKDAERMKTMNEKKLVKDQKLADKEDKNLGKEHKSKTHTVV